MTMVWKDDWDSGIWIPDLSVRLSLCIIAVTALVCFHTVVDGDFVFDDSEAVVNNDDVRLSTPLSQVFTNDFWGTRITHNNSHKSYRPLTILSFRLNIWAAGGKLLAPQFRLVNLLVYVIVCCLSLFIFKHLCAQHYSCHRVPFLSALLYTVHPIHTEAVAPVVGRADLLCALFMFSAFLFYHHAIEKKHSLIFRMFSMLCTIVLAATSMFTKEQGITVLALCSIYDLLISHKIHPRNLLQPKTWVTSKVQWLLVRQGILFTSTCLFLTFRWWIMGGTVPIFQKADNPASFSDSVLIRGINYIYIYALNMWLLLCPEWLCYDWSMGCVPLIESPHDLRILVVLTFTAAFGYLVFSLLRSTSEEARIQLGALAFIVVPFLPASNIFFRVGFVIAERTLFVPSLGFCLLITLGIRKLSSVRFWKRIIPLLLGLLVIVFCTRSHVRCSQWASERVLFLSALSICPLNAKVHYNLAKTSNHSVAVKHYRDALRLNPDYDQAMNNLANILKDRGELSEAEELLRRALQLRTNFAAAWMNLGIVLSNKKNFTEAEICYWNAVKYRRNYPDCFYNLGNLYLEQKEYKKAYDSWRQATVLNPKHHAAWNNLIIMLDSIGNHEEASSVGLEAILIFPNSSAIHFNIANSLGKINNFDKAEKHFKSAIEINPKNPLYFVNLGVLYHRWKKFNVAKEMYLKALKLDPNLKSAKDNLLLLQN